MAAVCALIAGLSVVAPGKIIYVDDDAKEYGNGSSWANPYKYLQAALTAASAGDEIRVAQGTYRPDQGLPSMSTRGRSGSTPVAAVFQLKNGVAIMGGFAGIGAEDPNARDTERYKAILSGDLQGNDVDLWGPGNPVYEFLRADNSAHVVQSIKTDATAVLDGFVIESAVDSDFFNQGGSPTIANCVFQKGSTPNSGGALRCDGGQPTLTNCLFQENNSTNSQGGAIDVLGGRLTLSNCRFLGNWAWKEGGAICCTNGDLALTGCTFERNAGSWGGAIHHAAGTLTLVDCAFEGNAANDGGAVAFLVEAASMTRCTFARNWATMSGGAVENKGGAAPTLDQCTFTGNEAGEGGAIYTLRIVAPAAGPGMVLTRCLFTGNRASSEGGALFDDNLGLTIVNGTFTGNWAQKAGTLGWRYVMAGDTPCQISLDNCIVWDGRGSISPVSLPTRGTSVMMKENVIIRYSDVQGGWAGEGNIDADPCFAAPGRWVDAADPAIVVPPEYSGATWVDGDYHVRSQAGRWDPASNSWVKDNVTSPCIDAGDPSIPVADEPEPNGGRINIGAYGGTTEASKSL
jgi:predicted outer membrane repeat protein